ncbi:hypothetical protein Ga0466249_002933 [Sporomusaceae bacterium BoRhaA]|nr:hypothetical protein [Pelorhabdus rhamnosifermentans]
MQSVLLVERLFLQRRRKVFFRFMWNIFFKEDVILYLFRNFND